MPITTVIPTQQQLAQIKQSPTSLLAMYQAANAPTPAVGSPAAVTAAGAGTGTGLGNQNLNNLSNPDWIKSMSEMISQINIDAQQKANAARIPNATGLEQKSSQNIQSALSGQIPNDVYQQMATRSAERGVSTGNPMGANSTADIMRALGLTSLDLQNQGQSWLTNALGRNPGATIANTQALVTTPAQAEALALQRQNMELDYLARMAAINAANNRSRAGYGYGGGGRPSGGGGASFAPATNWAGGGTTPITTPWHLPYSLDQGGGLDTVQPGMDFGGQFDQPGYNYDPYTPPAGTYYNPNTNTSDYLPFGDPYGVNIGGGIDQGGMSDEELDWLYNVGG